MFPIRESKALSWIVMATIVEEMKRLKYMSEKDRNLSYRNYLQEKSQS